MPKVPRIFVEIGQRFDRLVVIDPDARSFPTKAYPKGRRTPLVQCDCGTTKMVAIYDLLRGYTTSCGCLRDEVAVERIRQLNADLGNDHGGASAHPEFDTWGNIVQRCTNSKTPNFHRYGGRGIALHPAWLIDPWKFLDYLDLHLGPRPAGYSLDRIDNDGDYEPGNLRWASAAEQIANRYNTIRDTCSAGHDLTDENLYIDRGRRLCRTCVNAKRRVRYHARQQSA